MRAHPRSFLVVLLFSLSLFADLALGQSLSIVKDRQSWIVAGAPPTSRHALQVTQNLRLWLNVNDAVTGSVSNRIDMANVTQRYFRLIPWTEPRPITVVLLGDSTVADLDVNLGLFNGWGQGLYGYFKTNALIVNLAAPGYSTKRFLGSDEQWRMVGIKPDYVLVEFGLFDAFGVPAEVSTTLDEYEANLRAIVQMIRDFKGTPILVTPQAIRVFDANDKAVEAFPERNNIVRRLAAELQVYLIDLNKLSIDFLDRLGDHGSAYLWAGDPGSNWLHFTTQGAIDIAGLVACALPSPFGPYLITDKILNF